jgi:TrwC relaxase
VVVSIGRLASGRATADYYLDRQAGCQADYRTGPSERRGRWLGDGARAVGLTGPLDPAGEDALRALLDGRNPDGEKVLSPVLRLHPKARLPTAPLLDAIQQVVWDRGVEVPEHGPSRRGQDRRPRGMPAQTDNEPARCPRSLLACDRA